MKLLRPFCCPHQAPPSSKDRPNHGFRLIQQVGGSSTPSARSTQPTIELLLAAGKLRTEGQKRRTRYFAGKGGAAKPRAKADS